MSNVRARRDARERAKPGETSSKREPVQVSGEDVARVVCFLVSLALFFWIAARVRW